MTRQGYGRIVATSSAAGGAAIATHSLRQQPLFMA